MYPSLTLGNSAQTSHITIERLRIATILVGIVKLPESIERPAAGNGAGAAVVPCEYQRVGVDEGIGVARAGRPP